MIERDNLLLHEAASIIEELAQEWIWRLPGCSDEDCLICPRAKEFKGRVDSFLRSWDQP